MTSRRSLLLLAATAIALVIAPRAAADGDGGSPAMRGLEPAEERRARNVERQRQRRIDRQRGEDDFDRSQRLQREAERRARTREAERRRRAGLRPETEREASDRWSAELLFRDQTQLPTRGR